MYLIVYLCHYHAFFYKNKLYKNTEAQIGQENNVRYVTKTQILTRRQYVIPGFRSDDLRAFREKPTPLKNRPACLFEMMFEMMSV